MEELDISPYKRYRMHPDSLKRTKEAIKYQEQIKEALEDLKDSELKDVAYFLSNTVEFRLYDIYSSFAIDLDLYAKLKEKYPEEFL